MDNPQAKSYGNASVWCFLIFGLWIMWSLEPFWGLSMATGDQLFFALKGSLGEVGARVYNEAVGQGRIYFLLTKAIDFIAAAYSELFITKVLNFTTFALSILAFCYAMFKSCANRLLFIWVMLCMTWIGYDHLPPAAYPIVNHFSFLLWAITAFLVRHIAGCERVKILPVSLLALTCFLAFFQYEPITAFSIVAILWIVFNTDCIGRRRKWSLYGIVCLVFVAYIMLYLGWAIVYPSKYSGAALGSLSLFMILRTIIAYTVGALPRAILHQDYRLQWGDTVHGRGEIDYHTILTLSQIDLFTVCIVIVGVLALWSLYLSRLELRNTRVRFPFAACIFFIIFVLAVNGPIAVSAKYQQWAPDFYKTYLTSHLVLYPIAFIITCIITYICQRFSHYKQVISLVFIAGFGLIYLKVYDNNVVAGATIRALASKWQAVATIAQHGQQMGVDKIVAPQLFYAIRKNPESWSDYWYAYTQQRFSTPIHFYPNKDAVENHSNAATLQLYFTDGGTLRLITLQNEQGFWVLGDDTNWPNLFFTESGIPIQIDKEQAIVSRDNDLRYKHLRSVKTGNVYPVWGLPNDAARFR